MQFSLKMVNIFVFYCARHSDSYILYKIRYQIKIWSTHLNMCPVFLQCSKDNADKTLLIAEYFLCSLFSALYFLNYLLNFVTINDYFRWQMNLFRLKQFNVQRTQLSHLRSETNFSSLFQISLNYTLFFRFNENQVCKIGNILEIKLIIIIVKCLLYTI